jgi:hypothetical protein
MKGETPRPQISNTIAEHLDLIEKSSMELGFERTADRIKHIRKYLDTSGVRGALDFEGDAQMKDEIRVLRQAVEDDLEKRHVLFPDEEKFKKYYLKPKLFGNEVFQAFPAAQKDILDAGTCYATDNDTACVFHCMRVTEYGLRALAKRLRVSFGKRQHVEFADWGRVIKGLKAQIEEQLKKPRGPKRAEQLRFYSEAADQFAYFNHLWRTEVSHARRPYNSAEALNALTRTGDLMQALASHGLSYGARKKTPGSSAFQIDIIDPEK